MSHPSPTDTKATTPTLPEALERDLSIFENKMMDTYGVNHKLFRDFLARAVREAEDKVKAEFTPFLAWCDCGDSLRIDDTEGFYPKEAKYYCFGCDKYYKLIELPQSEEAGKEDENE